MEKKEEWINKTMDSLDGIHKVSPPDDLFEKIMSRVQQPILRKVPHVSKTTVYMVAAGIALIIALNIIVLVRKQAPEMNHTQAAAKSFIMEYFAEIEDN